MKKIKISACLITKNEELILENCLVNLKDIAEEIIVLDTGSTDRTIEIASKFGKVHKSKWNNDFSTARNECISYANGDWILSIDADEILSNETQKILPEFIEKQPLDQPLVFEFKVVAPVPGSDYMFANPYFKGSLFRNGFGISFKNPIHEHLTGEKLIIEKCPFLEIYHHEFLKPPEVLQQKQADYIESLLAIIRETSDIQEKCYYWLNLGQSYSMAGDSENALKTYFLAHQAFNIPETDNNNQVFLSILEGISNELIFRKKDYLRALKYLNKYLEINPDSATALYLLGYSQHSTGLFKDAVSSLEKALNLVKNSSEPNDSQALYDKTVLVNILCELGRGQISQGKDSEGIRLLTEALEIVPAYLRALLYLEKYFLLRQDLPKAVYYHLQNDFNYTEDQKLLFKQISNLSNLEPDYKKLMIQLLSHLEKMPAWTDEEKYELEDMIIFLSQS